ncbi:MAG: hypothetical protein WBB82_17740 [Limnothrix sp.]
MSIDKSLPAPFVDNDTLPKPHPERLFLLGSAWLAVMCLGVFGATTLVNPDAKLPLVDPLLKFIETYPERAEQKQKDAAFELYKQGKDESDVFGPVIAVDSIAEDAVRAIAIQNIADNPTIKKLVPTAPASKAIAIQDVVDNPTIKKLSPTEPAALATPIVVEPTPIASQTQTAPTTAPESVASPTPSRNIPVWTYLAIIASCASGSLLITYVLYQVSQRNKRLQRSPKSQKIKRKVVRNRNLGTVKPARKVAQNPAIAIAEQPVAKPVPLPKIIPAIAPLHISTPTKIEPPQLHLKPITDPAPAPRKISRAEQLANIASRAKEQPKKSLVDLVDIRRQGHLAQFP